MQPYILNNYMCNAFQMVNAIVHHAFPTRLELLFAFEYTGNTQAQTKPGLFNRPRGLLVSIRLDEWFYHSTTVSMIFW